MNVNVLVVLKGKFHSLVAVDRNFYKMSGRTCISCNKSVKILAGHRFNLGVNRVKKYKFERSSRVAHSKKLTLK